MTDYKEQLLSNKISLRNIPKEFITSELCILAVTQDCYALDEVPEELRTYEVCKLAVTQDRYALEYVPDHLQDEMRQVLRDNY